LLFQMKKGRGFPASLERRQIEAARESSEVRDRSFVCYVDEDRASVRIMKVTGLLSGRPPGQVTKKFPTTAWQSLSTWAGGWLSCDIGPPSDTRHPALEDRLQRYELASNETSSISEAPAHPLAWLLFALTPEGLDIAGSPVGHFFG
jgi:hypothetical protein